MSDTAQSSCISGNTESKISKQIGANIFALKECEAIS